MTYRMVYPSDPTFPEVEREMKSPTPRTCGRQTYYTDHRRHVPDGPTTGGIDNTPRHVDDGTVCEHDRVKP